MTKLPADKGDGDAMGSLGVVYAKGQGVAQEYAKAREWNEKAAQKGNANAMTNLGVLYASGQGVAQDYAKARGLDPTTPWTRRGGSTSL